MNDLSSEPDWERLRTAPQRFFELADGFDRKDLKRSYNSWIRRFKPETHPEEFQRIRAAYEDLDRRLRYGNQAEDIGHEPSSAASDRWESSADAVNAGSVRELAASDLLERLERETPDAVYLALQENESKSPFDYYALAVLSDICDQPNAARFGNWLLNGVEQFPYDHALRHLFYAYSQTRIPREELPHLLIQAAEVIRDDTFYPLTEPMWEQLLRQESLDVFVQTLGECEKHLRSLDISGKMAFTIRMLRPALWKIESASSEAIAWTTKSMEFIDTNFQHIPSHSEYEVDLLVLVQQYSRLRRDFIDAGGLRPRLDRVLEIYFTEDYLAGDRAVVLQQLQLTRDVEGLLEAFPYAVEDPPLSAFYSVWAWVSQEVAARYGAIDEEEPDIELWSKRAKSLLVQLEAKSNTSMLGMYWGVLSVVAELAKVLTYFLVGIGMLIPLLSLVFATGWFDPEEFATVMTIFGMVSAVVVATKYAGKWAAEKLLTRFYQPRNFRLGARCYRNFWRPEAADLLERSRLSFPIFRDLVEQHATHTDKATSGWIYYFISSDYGLAIYSLALRHVI